MKVFAIKHDGVCLGGVSLAVSESEEQARQQLKFALNDMKLEYKGDEKIVEIDTSKLNFYVLWNGDY